MQQINLNSIKIPEWVKYFGWILAIAFILWTKSCNSEVPKTRIITVTIPEKKGSFSPVKPDTIRITKILKGDHTTAENPLNRKLLEENQNLKDKFKSVNDSIKLKMFEEANQLNQFSSKFEDDNILLIINGIARGEVQEITPSYTIKKQSVLVPIKEKEVVFRLLGGVEIGNTKTLDNLSIKGSMMLQNRKGNIISAGYDTDNKIWVGYTQSIFNIKR